MGSFEMAKLNHEILGHNSFVSFLGDTKGSTFIYNICADLGCEKRSLPTDHSWDPVLFKNNPAMKCTKCGFIWQAHMKAPRVTCEQILAAKNKSHYQKKRQVTPNDTHKYFVKKGINA